MSDTDSTKLSSSDSDHRDWGIDKLVQALLLRRDQSRAARNVHLRSVKLPSRKIVAQITKGLQSALFPSRLGEREPVDESVDFFVGQTLDTSLHELFEQAIRELSLKSIDETAAIIRSRAGDIVRSFAEDLPAIRDALEQDLDFAREHDPFADSADVNLLSSPGVTAVLYYRLAHSLIRRGLTMIADMISRLAQFETSADIHPAAKIGERFSIGRGSGVVIGASAVIGRGVRLEHAVTLAASPHNSGQAESPIASHKVHPLLEDDVVVHSGAVIIGRVIVGKGAVIGHNARVSTNVPARARIAGAGYLSDDFLFGSGI